MESTGGAKKKRRTGGGIDSQPKEVEPAPRNGAESGSDIENPLGHPDCTSAEDCMGSPTDRLVRHILDGADGDLYCEICWESFKETNPHLEGRFEDDGM